MTVLCDTGERYLSKLYSDEWMRENQMLDADRATLMPRARERKDGNARRSSAWRRGRPCVRRLRLMTLHDVSQLPVMDGTNCVGSVSDWSLSAKSLENPKLLEQR